MYTIGLSSASPSAPRLPADAAIRVAAPIVTGLISIGGLIYSIHGKHHTAASIAVVGVILSSVVTAAQAVAYEQQRRAA